MPQRVRTITGTSGRLEFGRPRDSAPTTEEDDWGRQLEREGFPKLALRGRNGQLLWSYHEAASIVEWHVVRQGTAWTLKATLGTVHDFRIRQRPLLFVHQRPKPQGFWSWGIDRIESIQGKQLVAHLGPPEG